MLSIYKNGTNFVDFDRFIDDFLPITSSRLPKVNHIPVDIYTTDNEITVQADLPGYAIADVDISVEDGVLSIKATREDRGTDATRKQIERVYGAVQRSIRVGNDVDSAAVEATYRDGVLTVILPKREETRPRKITIKATS